MIDCAPLQSHTEVEPGISGQVAWMSYRIVDGGSYPRVQDAIFSMAIMIRAFKRATSLTPLACRHLGRSNLAKRRRQLSLHGTQDRPHAGAGTLHPLAQPVLDT